MANPNIPVHDGDIRFEDRGGVFALVDPSRPQGRDIAVAWPEENGRWRWRMTIQPADGSPHPTASCRDIALEDMLVAYARDPAVALRLEAQRPRFSFGQPQIFRA